MRWEERAIWVAQQVFGLMNTDTGHLLLLCVAACFAVKFYPAGLAPIGAAIFIKIKS
jgi:hypothetical protein